MRVAAGVLLIIAALFNLFASLGYMAGGAASGGLSDLSQVVAEANQAQGGEGLTAEEQAQLDEMSAGLDTAGGGLLFFGIFLLISVGILIAGAVFLFTNKKPGFIMIAGGMAILAEVIGILITTFGITNILGLVAGILAILAAKGMSGESGGDDSEPAAA